MPEKKKNAGENYKTKAPITWAFLGISFGGSDADTPGMLKSLLAVIEASDRKPRPETQASCFMVYASADRELREVIARHLNEQGAYVFRDFGEYSKSGDLRAARENRMREVSFVIALMSRAAFESRFVNEEIEIAQSLDKYIFAVRIGDAEVVRGLYDIQHVRWNSDADTPRLLPTYRYFLFMEIL